MCGSPRVSRVTAAQRRVRSPEQLMVALSAPLTAAMSEQARRAGVTVNTIVQAAWAILLGRLLGRDDVVFGVTVAGRPPELAGIERMVGLFINTLPLRVKLAPEKPLLALLREVQDEQSKLIAHQHVGLSRRFRARWGWASCSTRWWCLRTTRWTGASVRQQRIMMACGSWGSAGAMRRITRSV